MDNKAIKLNDYAVDKNEIIKIAGKLFSNIGIMRMFKKSVGFIVSHIDKCIAIMNEYGPGTSNLTLTVVRLSLIHLHFNNRIELGYNHIHALSNYSEVLPRYFKIHHGVEYSHLPYEFRKLLLSIMLKNHLTSIKQVRKEHLFELRDYCSSIGLLIKIEENIAFPVSM